MSDPILLRHAQVQTPRYSSYPTTPHFTAAVGEAVYRQWLAEVHTAARGALYLHVPFCRETCWNCGCHSGAMRHAAPVERYIDTLEHEIAFAAAHIPHKLAIDRIDWGGGSPTLVRPERLVQAATLLRHAFAVSADAEVTIKVDPEAMTHGLAGALAMAGFNRASLEVLTLDPQVQRAINRVQSYDSTARCAARLRAAGIRSLNVDLLYGLPHQSVDSCRSTVEQVLALAPGRLAVTGYAHTPQTKPHQRAFDAAALPDAAARLDQATALHDLLTGAGYVAIGTDRYALPGDPLALAAREGRLHRSFQGYATVAADVLLGFGASAIGQLPQGHVQNAPASGPWESAIRNGGLATARGHALDDDDRLRGAIIAQLLCHLTVDLDALAAAHGRPVPAADLSALETDGVVVREGARLTIAPRYRLLARNVAAAFDARLTPGKARQPSSA